MLPRWFAHLGTQKENGMPTPGIPSISTPNVPKTPYWIGVAPFGAPDCVTRTVRVA